MSRIWQSLKNTLKGKSAVEAAVKTEEAAAAVAVPDLSAVDLQQPSTSGNAQPSLLDFSKLKTVSPHVPLIRFGRHPEIPVDHYGAELLDNPTVIPTIPSYSHNNTGAIDWWELPGKYRRHQIDLAECDVINSGGSDKYWQ